MIEYLENSSSYFKEHETFCKRVESELADFNPNITGYCDSNGFKIQFQLELNFTHVEINYENSYSTQGGTGLIYSSGKYSLEININKEINNSNKFLLIKRSKFLRLFMNRNLKKITPKEFYMKSNLVVDTTLLDSIFDIVRKNNIWYIKYRNAKMHCQMYDVNVFPNQLINEIDKLTQLYMNASIIYK